MNLDSLLSDVRSAAAGVFVVGVICALVYGFIKREWGGVIAILGGAIALAAFILTPAGETIITNMSNTLWGQG